MAQKATVKLAGVPLAGVRAIVWRLQTGVTPYQTTFQVHKSQWKKLKGQLAKPLVLEFVDGVGTKQTIREVYILEELPSDSPNRVTFLVSDRRWKWPKVLVSRDYNIPKRTGDRTILNPEVPAGTETFIDKYDYKGYSLKNGEKRWTAQQAVEDVLRVITEDEKNKWAVVSFPIEDTDEEEGGFLLQNIVLRDSGDVALARMLASVPGAAIYVTVLGQVHVIDAVDLKASEEHLKTLKPTTWSGEFPRMIDRSAQRPARVRVHYQREIELLVEFDDDLANRTQAAKLGARSDAYCLNVIPTVDPTTKMDVWNPDTVSFDKDVDVPAGTYVNVEKWLEAMNKLKPTGSWPWTFDLVKTHFFINTLEGVWMGNASRGVVDDVVDGDVMARIQTFKQHFRQTFKINPIYMDSIRSITANRVAPLDPVTGARAPAGVWSQATITPTDKGDFIYARRVVGRDGKWILVDNTPQNTAAEGEEPVFPDVTASPPSAARLTFIDRDQGIFRVQWVASPFATEDAILPCHVTDVSGDKKVPIRQIKEQDNGGIMGPQLRREGSTDHQSLSDVMILKAICTIVPGAPNNKKQYHIEVVEAADVDELYRAEYRIQNGKGPDLEVFISPGEVTARFAWGDSQLKADPVAREQMKTLLGTRDEDPTTAGLPEGTTDITGFTFVNHKREIGPHAKAVAAEVLAAYADTLSGRVATRLPKKTLEIKGHIRSAEIRVGAHPSAKIDAVHDFPGVQMQVSRFALLPDSSRKLILGIIDGVIHNE